MEQTRDQLEQRVRERTTDTLGHLLQRTARLFMQQAVQAVRAAGHPDVRQSWLGLLPHLEPRGVRTSDLAGRLEVTRQAAGQLISEVERLGYVERVPDPSDGRAKLVRMTERGWAAWLAGLDAMRTLEDELEQEIGPEAVAALRIHAPALLAAIERRSMETR